MATLHEQRGLCGCNSGKSWRSALPRNIVNVQLPAAKDERNDRKRFAVRERQLKRQSASALCLSALSLLRPSICSLRRALSCRRAAPCIFIQAQ